MSATSSRRSEPFVGQRWLGPLGNREVSWKVTWVGVRKARLKAEVEYGWATVTVWIDRWLDNPDWTPLDTRG